MRKTTFVRPQSFRFHLSCFVALGLIYLPAFAQESTSAAAFGKEAPATALPSDPKTLMQLAKKINGLTGPELPPWHLKSTFKAFDEKGDPKDQGTFEELWAAPNKFKLIYTSTSFSQTEYGTWKGTLGTGDHHFPPDPLSFLQFLTVNPLPSDMQINRGELDLQQRDVEGIRLNCFDLRNSPSVVPIDPKTNQPIAPVPVSSSGPSATYCMDARNILVQSITGILEKIRASYTNPLIFQGRNLPGDLILERGGVVILRSHVESIELLNVNEADFQPSTDAAPLALSESQRPIAPQQFSLSADVAAGYLSHAVAPVYPPIAKAARVSGTVVLQATLSKQGAIENLRVISGPPLLQQAALDAVKQWVYRPYLLNGEPVEVNTTINVIFNLSVPSPK